MGQRNNIFDNSPYAKGSNKVGIATTVVIHVIILFLLIKFGYPIVYPLPEEKGIEINLVAELKPEVELGFKGNPEQKVVENPPIINDPGNMAPQSARIDKTNQSTRPTVQPKAKPSELSNFGDVETKKVDSTKKPNPKGLFQSTTQGTEEANAPRTPNDRGRFPGGVGNSDESTRTPNTPIGPEHRQMVTASLSGRSGVGTWPMPSYNSQNQGRVVVEIAVNQNGVVTKADVRMMGTTVQDASLWEAAKAAALKARFNISKDAPVSQTGTITYNFKLN